MKKKFKELLLLFLTALLIEIFIFNIRGFDTAFNIEKKLDSSYEVELFGGNFDTNGDIVMDADTEYVALYITGLDYSVKNIRLDVECMDDEISPYIPDHVCNVKVSAFDDALFEQVDEYGNSYMSDAAAVSAFGDVLHDEEASHYIYLVPFGDTHKLEILLSPATGMPQRLRIHELTFNAVRPISINPARITVVYSILLLLYFSFINRTLWKEDCADPSVRKKIMSVGGFLVFSIFSIWIMLSNKALLNEAFSPYDLLARAISAGRLYVGEASELVKKTDGLAVFWHEDSTLVMFDYALFEGKYYVYFGLLPCVLFYLPYYMITGSDLPNIIPEILLRIITVLLLGRVIYIIIRRYYKKTPFALFLLLWCAVVAGMYIPAMLVGTVMFYDIPIFCGLVLVLAGLCFILESDKDGKNFSVAKLALGSICFASVSLCRPNMLLYGFVVLAMLFWNSRQRVKTMDGKKIREVIMAVGIPYVFFATVCMIYNYIRFGSPFDFGAAYNATTYPLTVSSLFLPYVIAKSIYEYLLRPPFIKFGYPFTKFTGWEQILEAGNTMVMDVFVGGIIASNPFTWLLLLSGKFVKGLKEKKILASLVLLNIVAFILMTYSVLFTSSLYTRYTLEFSPVILISASIIVLELYERLSASDSCELKHIVTTIITIMLLVSVFWGGAQLCCGDTDGWSLICGNTALWYKVSNAFRVLN